MSSPPTAAPDRAPRRDPEHDPGREPRAASARWELWGTYAFLAVTDPSTLSAATSTAQLVLDDIDRACSRFRPDSSLSEVNRHAGRWVEADPLLVAALRVALDAARWTEGLVDPCLGAVLVSLGYDRDLEAVVTRPPSLPMPSTVHRRNAWRAIEVAEAAIRIPAGVSLDLGATCKAWAADLLAETLVEELGCGVVVSLGGDLRVLGPEGSAPSWPVQVTERPGDSDGLEVAVTDGLATSSTLVRRWWTTLGEQHHLLDPRTGRPVQGPYRTVTAAGRSCVAANTASTAALVLGEAAPSWLEARDVTARLVSADGAVTTVGGWPAEPGNRAKSSGGGAHAV